MPKIKIRRLFNMIIKSVGLVDRPAIQEDFVEVKRAVPFKAHPLADRSREWDADAAIARIRVWAGASSPEDLDGMDFGKYREAFAWYDETAPENLGSYKLPHHDIINGQLYTVFRGTSAARAALSGARGGVEIPDADRPRVEQHLDMHLEEFEGDEESAREKSTEESMKKEEILSLLEPFGKRIDELEKKLADAGSEEAKKSLVEVREAVEGVKASVEEVKGSVAELKKADDEIVEETCKRFEQSEAAIEKLGKGTSSKIAGQEDGEKKEGENKSKFPSLAHLAPRRGA